MLEKAAWGQAGDREVMIPGRDEVKSQGHRSKFRGQCHRSKATRIKISNLLQVTTNMLVFVKRDCTLFLYIFIYVKMRNCLVSWR